MNTRWHRVGKLSAFAAIIAMIGYAGLAVKCFYDVESPFLALESESRRTANLHSKIYDAINTLTDNGAEDLADRKGACPAVFDLSKWHGTDKELASLRTIARLPVLRSNDNSLYLKLGPSITSTALPILCDLKNLRRIELNGANLSDSEVQDLMTELPNCTIGEVSWDTLFPPIQNTATSNHR